MAWLALALFLAAAVGGLIMAVRVFVGKEPPVPLAAIHGLAAATGLVLLGLVWLNARANGLMVTALILFLIAALGGFFLLSFHLRGAAHPRVVVALHAVLAVAGAAALLIGLL